MRPVHLRVVELERNGKCRFQQAALVFAPNEERIIKNAAIHPDSPVYFILCVDSKSGNVADEFGALQGLPETSYHQEKPNLLTW